VAVFRSWLPACRGFDVWDQTPAQKLWNRHFEELVRQARDWLRGAPRSVADEEDAALSAFGKPPDRETGAPTGGRWGNFAFKWRVAPLAADVK
jgi:hypothetical protein